LIYHSTGKSGGVRGGEGRVSEQKAFRNNRKDDKDMDDPNCGEHHPFQK